MALFIRQSLIVALFTMPVLSSGAGAQPGMYDPKLYIVEKRIREVHDAIEDFIRPKKSPISMLDARVIVTFGTFSAMAQRCKFAWKERIYQPLMANYRHGRKLSERQMKIVSFMHGFQKSSVLKQLPEGSCSPEIRSFLSQNLWGQKVRQTVNPGHHPSQSLPATRSR